MFLSWWYDGSIRHGYSCEYLFCLCTHHMDNIPRCSSQDLEQTNSNHRDNRNQKLLVLDGTSEPWDRRKKGTKKNFKLQVFTVYWAGIVLTVLLLSLIQLIIGIRHSCLPTFYHILRREQVCPCTIQYAPPLFAGLFSCSRSQESKAHLGNMRYIKSKDYWVARIFKK